MAAPPDNRSHNSRYVPLEEMPALEQPRETHAPRAQPVEQMSPDNQSQRKPESTRRHESTSDTPNLLSPSDTHKSSGPGASTYSTGSRFSKLRSRIPRAATNLEFTPLQERVSQRKYAVRRPRALQVRYNGRIVEVGDEGAVDLDAVERHLERNEGEHVAHSERRSTDFIDTQRERLELFIDLLFVGIVTNLSEHYFTRAFSTSATEGSSGQAVSEFLLLFLPTWRIFAELQNFLSSYYTDDALTRLVVLWVLVLALVWGNNAPNMLSAYATPETPEVGQSPFAVVTYLIASSSLKIVEVFYSIWIPWIRRLVLLSWLIGLPSLALWIAVCLTKHDTQVGLLGLVISFDYIMVIFMRSPPGDRLLGDSHHLKKVQNISHTRQRYSQFFIISIGEGVILLLRNSPLGFGFSSQMGIGVQALLTYFLLHWIYFNGDNTKATVHALHRRWWISSLWQLMHIQLYGSILLLSSGMLYLVEYSGHVAEDPASEGPGAVARRAEEGTALMDHANMRVATVTVFCAMACALMGTLVIALLNRPLDNDKTLVINNRWVRLLPRFLAVLLFATIWLIDFLVSSDVTGILASVMFIVYCWEWWSGLERGWKWFER